MELENNRNAKRPVVNVKIGISEMEKLSLILNIITGCNAHLDIIVVCQDLKMKKKERHFV